MSATFWDRLPNLRVESLVIQPANVNPVVELEPLRQGHNQAEILTFLTPTYRATMVAMLATSVHRLNA